MVAPEGGALETTRSFSSQTAGQVGSRAAGHVHSVGASQHNHGSNKTENPTLRTGNSPPCLCRNFQRAQPPIDPIDIDYERLITSRRDFVLH